MSNIFERASRLKLRFNTPNGLITTEDLWALPLTSKTGKANLDDIARQLHKQLKSGDDISFVDTEKKSDSTVQLAFDVVKYVIDARIAENAAAADREQRAEKKKFLLSVLADKQSEAFKSMSAEELQRQIAAL